MIENISIKNYRNLKELEIPSLGRVNLIAGKNNTGKSSFLEALTLLFSKGNFEDIIFLLKGRGESFSTELSASNNVIEGMVNSFTSLFSDWKVDLFSNLYNIDIKSNNGTISLQLLKYIDEESKGLNGEFQRKRIEISKEVEVNHPESNIGLRIKSSDFSYIIPITRSTLMSYTRPSFSDQVNYRLLKTDAIQKNEELWDKITLSSKENIVLEALRIIDPNIERLAFINYRNNSIKRTPVVTLRGTERRIPLSSMGDGMNKVLKIILALVNAENGYLLIDEFENGLHHSVQDELWGLVFKFAYEHNIQVFATTHSDDSIYSFENALNSKEEYNDSKLFRFDRKADKTVAIEYTAEDLAIATDQNIETR